MPKIVDVCDDKDQRIFHKIQKLVEMPPFVKDATPPSLDDTAALPNVVFADPTRRKFPCHNKAATWLSQLYFLESRHTYPTQEVARVQEKISRAARFHSIMEDITKAARAWETHQKTAIGDLSDADFAMVVDHDGQKLRRFPITNAENVKAAATHLYVNRRSYPYDWRKIAARKILHKAAELETQIDPALHEYLAKAAGFGSTAPRVAAEKIASRQLLIPDEQKDLKIKLARLAVTVANMPGIPPADQMEKLAQIIDRLDREFGFHTLYDETLDTPEEMFFGLTEKKAQLFRDGHFQLTTGTVIPYAALERVELHKVADALGDEFSKAVQSDKSLDVDIEKFGRVAATLPLGDARLLERALKHAGALAQTPGLVDIAVK